MAMAVGEKLSPPHAAALCDLSVIIPVFNEIDGIDRCYRQVTSHLEKTSLRFELVFVDDGSSDGSLERLRSFAKNDPRVIAIKLLHNIGQQNAMYAALPYASGRAIITYDSDLQFHPNCLAALAEKIFEGFDIAGGVRIERKDPLFFNRLPSWIGKRLINKALRANIADFGGVKAYSARLVRILLTLDSPRIVLPAMAYSVSRNAIEIPVSHEARIAGQSKWSILSRMELYLDVFTLYARRPFASMMIAGILSISAGIFIGFGVLCYWAFVSKSFSGLIIFFDMFLLVTGAYFVSLALIGEFVVRGFRSRRMDASSLIEEVITSPGSPPAASD